ncbi:hypothetical protein Cgig2_020899 [Carnegiea gigantea]|uniref:Uncharacterized protein n=1 Tax=Carnegiea gigantea TaxID=171969 RepID=A0A9Q1GN08_9CARY|nr:hypothetical protein Cgig2_020899 [Carnegiea gigantea]
MISLPQGVPASREREKEERDKGKMGSSFFGVPNNIGNGRCSSRKSKKSDKPRQPQRGLGVAQLEQIRLRSQMAYGLTPPYNRPLQDDMRLQGVQPYGPPQSSTSYPYSQSLPSTSSHYAYNPNYTMVLGDERADTRYNEPPYQSTAPRWNRTSNGVVDNSPYTEADMASGHLFSHSEDSSQKMDLWRSTGSSGQYSNSSDHEEVDLELRLSI